MQIYEELQARGLIAQVTDEPQIRELINHGGAKFYIGFDPTADSLHVGHFMALCLMKRLQMAGNKPVVLLGGGTGFIGDPSGRTDMRSMMHAETIRHNCECFKKQMERFIEFGEDEAIVVNNADWLLDLNYIDLLRDVGPCFSVNAMLRAECYRQRMERGLSFFEFNYMIMQAYDFLYLHSHYGCNMQFGGDDQWSNMLAGTDLIRRKTGKDAYDLTNLIHGEEEARRAREASRALFAGAGDDSHMPETLRGEGDVPDDGIRLLDLLAACGLASSKTEARRLIQQGGVSIDGSRVNTIDFVVAKADLFHGIKIKKGKKIYRRVVVK